MAEYLKVVAIYVSGREEVHRVKKTKGASNKALEKLINKFVKMPTIIKWRIENNDSIR